MSPHVYIYYAKSSYLAISHINTSRYYKFIARFTAPLLKPNIYGWHFHNLSEIHLTVKVVRHRLGKRQDEL